MPNSQRPQHITAHGGHKIERKYRTQGVSFRSTSRRTCRSNTHSHHRTTTEKQVLKVFSDTVTLRTKPHSQLIVGTEQPRSALRANQNTIQASSRDRRARSVQAAHKHDVGGCNSAGVSIGCDSLHLDVLAGIGLHYRATADGLPVGCGRVAESAHSSPHITRRTY
jgi:hypothetical protein